jgi:tetratricopeptide (TPR) repeat protein
MVMEAYDGKPVPERLWTGDILNAFCEAKIFGRTDEERERLAPRGQLVTELVRLMRKLKRDNFLRDELHDFSAEWSKALLERELTRSPYLQLLDEGVLMETPITEEWGRFRRIVGYQVRFAFEPLFEFLLSNELLAEGGGWKGLTGEKVAKWLSEGRDFDHLTGAVTLLLTEAVQEGNLNLVTETLNATGIELAEPVIIEVLTTLEGLKDERFEPLLDELAEKAESEKALTVLINASYQFGIKQRYHPTLACTERAEQLAKYLVEVEGRKELANDLAMALMNKGNALSALGHHNEAIDCYNEAIEIYRRLVEIEGRVELANYLAIALMNKGNALRDSGRLNEAIDCYDEAIEIYRRLVEIEGRVELADYLATALINKGVALRDLGRLNEALQCYDEGIGLREMMMVEGKVHVAPSLIKGLGIRFELKRQMRDWDGAADDVRKVLARVMPFLSSGSLTEALAMEFDEFLQRLRQLKEEEWTALASALGEDAELVRQLMQLWSEGAGG